MTQTAFLDQIGGWQQKKSIHVADPPLLFLTHAGTLGKFLIFAL